MGGSSELSGKFRFIAEIGHGGMSEVFLALTQGGLGGFQKLVAVKLLRRDLAEDEDFRQMFLEEARLTARLSHPNVVQTNDVGEDAGRYYIAMEYLEGQTFERVRRSRTAGKLFPLNMQIQMLVHVLSGLHYAHELADYDNSPMSIVHRDVTPSNVFITYDGQVKLVDFGIAKVLDSLNQTRVGVLKGKARYMSPEQISSGPVDRRADIFSVGVMLWEMLAGSQIWLGTSETEILRRVARGDIPALPRDASPLLQQICAKAMAFEADQRYATAEALRADLDVYLAQHATPSRDKTLGAALTEMFREERSQIRQLIEAQLKGSLPGSAALPALRDVRARPNGGSLDGFSGSDLLPNVSVQTSQGGKPAAEHVAAAPLSPHRKLYYLAAGALAAVLILGGIALSRGRGTPPAPPSDAKPAPRRRSRRRWPPRSYRRRSRSRRWCAG